MGWARSLGRERGVGIAMTVLVAAAVCGAAPRAGAGVELTTELADARARDQSIAPRPGRMLLESDRVRLEMSSASSDPKRVMIFRGDRDVVWGLDEKRRVYSEMDRETMRGMREKMRASLDKMPPGQRAQMEAMLAARDPEKREKPTITPTGRTDKVSGFACREFEVMRAGKKESEICVAEWRATGISRDDLGAVRKLGAFQDDAFGAAQRAEADDLLTLFDQLDGLPVRVRSFRDGRPTTEFRVVKVERKALDPKLFDVPDGYSKRSVTGTPTHSGVMAPPGRPAPAE